MVFGDVMFPEAADLGEDVVSALVIVDGDVLLLSEG